jgi:hypothetical protein
MPNCLSFPRCRDPVFIYQHFFAPSHPIIVKLLATSMCFSEGQTYSKCSTCPYPQTANHPPPQSQQKEIRIS